MKRVAPLLLMLCAPQHGLAAACDGTLDGILHRYVEAAGGTAALGRQTSLRVSATYREGDMRARFDFRVQRPHYMRIKATFDDGGTYEEGFDGESAWERSDGGSAKLVDDAAANALRQSAESPTHVYGLHDMVGLGASVVFSGCAVLGGVNYYVVNVQSRFGSNIDYYLTVDGHRLERSRTTRPLHPTQDPTLVTIEERWSDFRRVDGVWRPFVQTQWNADSGERISTLTVESMVPNEIENPRDYRIPADP